MGSETIFRIEEYWTFIHIQAVNDSFDSFGPKGSNMGVNNHFLEEIANSTVATVSVNWTLGVGWGRGWGVNQWTLKALFA